jgi:phage shock protein E
MPRVRLLAVLVSSLFACSKSEAPPSPAPPTAPPTAQTATGGELAPAAVQMQVVKPLVSAKDPETARKLIAAGAVVVDVRTPEEFAEEHLPQATNIPVQDFEKRIAEVEKLAGGDKSRPIVVYCAAGSRAARAKNQLESAGYTQVVNGGGFDDVR